MNLLRWCDRTIEYSFYLLFFLVPLYFTNVTSELFELNKMWITWGLTIIIALAWGTKMTVERRIHIQRTPLDIPLVLFLLSQLISTIFSMDQRISLWGYYSRFNGGFLSLLSYIFLYYAFVSNFTAIEELKRKPFASATRGVMAVVGGAIFLLGILFAGGIAKTGDSSLQAVSSTIFFFTLLISFPFFIWAQTPGFLKRILGITLITGLIVALWGLPSHFGADPTCLIFRGSLDVSCWTDAFQPKIRIFSTLGQPAWMAAYMALLTPLAVSYFLNHWLENKKSEASNPKQIQNSKFKTQHSQLPITDYRLPIVYLLLAFLFYADLIFSNTRAGFVGFWIANVLFWIALYFRHLLYSSLFLRLAIIINAGFLILSFFFGTTFPAIDRFTFQGFTAHAQSAAVQPTTPPAHKPTQPPAAPAGELGGTDSGKIREYVWQGAIRAWEDHPLIGTGVETFAFAYYLYRPAAHNMTSEWDYLYNKAHNEYLNYLTTTGIFGLGTYLVIIGLFLYLAVKVLISDQLANGKSKTESHKSSSSESAFRPLLVTGLLAGYISILITNFFGFSVVIINLYLFLIPAIVFVIADLLPNKAIIFPFGSSGISGSFSTSSVSRSSGTVKSIRINPYQWTIFAVLCIAAIYILFSLFRFWVADTQYALGHNLDDVGHFQEAFQPLSNAYQIRPTEPVFADELAINTATIAYAFAQQKDTNHATQFAQQALQLTNQVVTNHPNDIVYLKDQVRIYYTLGQIDSHYLSAALQTMQQAAALAPTDAKVWYNLGILYGQTGDLKNGITTLDKTIQLKPDYADAYLARGLFYHQEAVDKQGTVTNPDLEQKAVASVKYILTNLDPGNAQAKKQLQDWGAI